MLRQWMRSGSIATAILFSLVLLVHFTWWRPDQYSLERLDAGDDENTDTEAAGHGAHEKLNGAHDQPEWLQASKGSVKSPSSNKPVDGQKPATVSFDPVEIRTASTSQTHVPTATTSETDAPTPASTEITKAVVMGRLKTEDTSWVTEYLDDWQPFVYYIDLPASETSPSGLRTRINKSKEAMPYLTYIIQHYPNFPDVSVFIHAHRNGWPQAWHNDVQDHDAVAMLHGLRLDTVMDRGYVNLRCNAVPGCPSEIQPYRSPPDPARLTELIYPAVYAHFFGKKLEAVREEIEVVATPCCAQFAVSKEQILQRPKSDYERYRRYVEETGYDDDTIGRVLEYMWHIIFGRGAVDCEVVGRCYCAVYGKC